MLKKLLVLVMLLIPAQYSLAAGHDWVMYDAIELCDKDFYCLARHIDHMANRSPFGLASRAIEGKKIRPAKITRIKEGRNYRNGLYYTIFEESQYTRAGWRYCDMKIYYHPKTKKFSKIDFSGDCAAAGVPDIGGFTFRNISPEK